MRICCPYCGERDRAEFTHLGDASVSRPVSSSPGAMFDYVYLRQNHAGPIEEFWYHGGGCHAWLIVTRNTVTHEISAVKPAREIMVARNGVSHP